MTKFPRKASKFEKPLALEPAVGPARRGQAPWCVSVGRWCYAGNRDVQQAGLCRKATQAAATHDPLSSYIDGECRRQRIGLFRQEGHGPRTHVASHQRGRRARRSVQELFQVSWASTGQTSVKPGWRVGLHGQQACWCTEECAPWRGGGSPTACVGGGLSPHAALSRGGDRLAVDAASSAPRRKTKRSSYEQMIAARGQSPLDAEQGVRQRAVAPAGRQPKSPARHKMCSSGSRREDVAPKVFCGGFWYRVKLPGHGARPT